MNLAIVLAAVVGFFLVRELVTWYSKQNKLVEQNIEIIRLLRRLANESEVQETKTSWFPFWK